MVQDLEYVNDDDYEDNPVEISPLSVGLGTHITLSRNGTLSSLADFISLLVSLLTSSTVGSRLCLYLARGCYLSYCLCRFPPTVSRALIIIRYWS